MKKPWRLIPAECMNLELFIAKRIYFKLGEKKKTSPPAIRIAIAGMALGLTVMILAVAIVIGFKKEIRDKVIGFGSHIQISSFDNNTSYETAPIGLSDSLAIILSGHPEIKHIEYYATKPAILKTDDQFQGVALKGVAANYDWSFIKDNLVEGTIPVFTDSAASNEILISRRIADKLHLSAGESVFAYFVQDGVDVRKFRITGIYETNFEEYDKLFLIGDVRQIQRLNGWAADQYSGIELMLDDYDRVQEVAEQLYYECIERDDPYGETYYVRSVQELNYQLFSWLDMLDTNVAVILALMALVSGFTMISGLLIIIMERISMIGVLKALGMSNGRIRKTFVYVSVFLVGKGMFWGNLIGVGLCWMQSYFKILKLNPETYSLTTVPVSLNVSIWLLLNLASLFVSVLMLIGSTYMISLVRPAKSIKFE